jgi:hypothetical protein
MYSRILLAILGFALSTGVASALHTLAPRTTRPIAANMALKPTPFAFAWTGQGNG